MASSDSDGAATPAMGSTMDSGRALDSAGAGSDVITVFSTSPSLGGNSGADAAALLGSSAHSAHGGSAHGGSAHGGSAPGGAADGGGQHVRPMTEDWPAPPPPFTPGSVGHPGGSGVMMPPPFLDSPRLQRPTHRPPGMTLRVSLSPPIP